jgi:Asp/Glu/hydantoin racemase
VVDFPSSEPKSNQFLMAKAANEDGAEALFVSCVVTSAFLSMQGVREVSGTPVIDPVAASLKLTETLVDLKRAYGTGVCRRSIYTALVPGWEKQIPIIVD